LSYAASSIHETAALDRQPADMKSASLSSRRHTGKSRGQPRFSRQLAAERQRKLIRHSRARARRRSFAPFVTAPYRVHQPDGVRRRAVRTEACRNRVSGSQLGRGANSLKPAAQIGGSASTSLTILIRRNLLGKESGIPVDFECRRQPETASARGSFSPGQRGWSWFCPRARPRRRRFFPRTIGNSASSAGNGNGRFVSSDAATFAMPAEAQPAVQDEDERRSTAARRNPS